MQSESKKATTWNTKKQNKKTENKVSIDRQFKTKKKNKQKTQNNNNDKTKNKNKVKTQHTTNKHN